MWERRVRREVFDLAAGSSRCTQRSYTLRAGCTHRLGDGLWERRVRRELFDLVAGSSRCTQRSYTPRAG